MDTNKMLAEFEAAFVAKYGFGRLTASANADAHAMYEAAKWAWQASREAVVVELPARQAYESHADTSSFKDGFNRCHTESRDLIEAQGLKVEVAP